MKKFVLFLAFLVLIPLMVFGQDIPVDPVKITWHTIVLLLAGIYEAVVRVIPTVSNYSFIGKIIEILLWVSNFLNIKKKKK